MNSATPERRSTREIWPLEVKNLSSESAPPHAILQVVSCAKNNRGAMVYSVTKPDGTPGASHLIGYPLSIRGSGGHGFATNTLPVPVRLYSTSGATVGADWGPIPDSWGIGDAGDGYILTSGAIGLVATARLKVGGGGGTDHPIVKLRNVGGLPIPARSIFPMGTPTFDPATELAEFLARQVWLDVEYPISGNPISPTSPLLAAPFCVAIQDISVDVQEPPIGDAVCVGVVQVLLNYTNANHQFAHLEGTPTGISPDRLISDGSGRASIVWRELQGVSGPSSLGVQWALVYLGSATGGGIEKFGVVAASEFGGAGISALTGFSGQVLTPGSGSVQLYNSDGTLQKDENDDPIFETWHNWMNVEVPPHTTVMGNVHSDGTTWVKVAPCGPLEQDTGGTE